MTRPRFKPFGPALLVVALLAAGSAALADRGGDGHRHVHGPGFGHGQVQAHGHVHGTARLGIGIQLGPGFFYPAYPYYPYYPYYYPYRLGYDSGYYYGPSYVVPSSPPRYIEWGDEEVVPAPAYWYHCAKPEGYYPYVTTCPGGWQRVPAQPPATAR